MLSKRCLACQANNKIYCLFTADMVKVKDKTIIHMTFTAHSFKNYALRNYQAPDSMLKEALDWSHWMVM